MGIFDRAKETLAEGSGRAANVGGQRDQTGRPEDVAADGDSGDGERGRSTGQQDERAGAADDPVG